MAKRGAPKGNLYAEKHGLIAVKVAVARRARRGRDRVDKRTLEGKEALDLRGRYIEDKGGMDDLSTGEFMAIIGLSEAWWLRAMQYGAVASLCARIRASLQTRKRLHSCFSTSAPLKKR